MANEHAKINAKTPPSEDVHDALRDLAASPKTRVTARPPDTV